jgi:hypothetical protein
LKPRHGRLPPPRKYKSSVRFLIWLCGVAVISWFVISRSIWERDSTRVTSAVPHGGIYEVKELDTLPEVPSAVVVSDRRGRARWTVSIPPELDFPLRPSRYAELCSESMDVSMHVAGLKSHGKAGHGGHHGYYHVDRNFMDVAEAEEHGLLPGVGGKESTSAPTESSRAKQVCEKSLTYVLETEDAGLGSTLMGLWLSYGLAQKEGRAFFIDDTNWYDTSKALAY